VSTNEPTGRRSYGTGRVYVRTDKNGRETYYGSWYAGDRRVNRRLGSKRAPGERDGLTATQAETELRRKMSDEGAIANVGEHIDVAELGRRYLRHLEAIGRKKSTTTAVESTLRVWINPVLGGRDVPRVTPEEIEDLMRTMRAKLGAKASATTSGPSRRCIATRCILGASGRPSTRVMRSTCRAASSTPTRSAFSPSTRLSSSSTRPSKVRTHWTGRCS